MRFEQLIRKVDQAENAIEANERAAGADLRQLKASWRELWTPGRIVLGGLGAGFLVGLADANRMASTGTGALRLMSMVASLSGLVAGTSAQSAAEEAGQAAEAVSTGAMPGAAAAGLGAALRDNERLARAADAARAAGAEP